MTTGLCITLATRGRPDILCDTLRRTLPMLARDDTRIVVATDFDDPKAEHTFFADIPKDERIVGCIRDREDSIGEKWNRGFSLYPDAAVHMHQADYTVHMTPGFDQLMLDAAVLFPDGIGVVFAAMANMSFSGTQGVTKRLCELLGWGGMYPPYFPYWFVDHWIDDIARLIGRISYADVHMTTPARKNPTQEFREPAFWAMFYDAMKLMRRRQAAEIIRAMDESEWRKTILLSHHPLIEFRSHCINDYVRQMPDTATSDGGERYARLKAQAHRMLAEEWPELQKVAA